MTNKNGNPWFKKEFQLTRSRGAWHSGFATGTNYQDFNSHAHVERDVQALILTAFTEISTHTLTWSVTISPLMLQQNTLFQLTRSRGAWPAESCNVATNEGDFNSHAHVERDPEWKDLVKTEEFQLTRSRGAWRKRCWYGQADFGFQLTRSRGAWHSRYYFNRSILKFQLTRSRGAWHSAQTFVRAMVTNFNSHAHVERDKQTMLLWIKIFYFNSHAHVERDMYVRRFSKF